MAFINEMIPKEERCEYEISYRKIKPYWWTIDKDKDIKLFEYWTNIDNPCEKSFGLIWHNNIIKVVLIKKIEANTVFWSLDTIEIPSELMLNKKDIVEELRNAMKVYGSNGTKFADGKSWSKREVETKICF